ncbi:MAG: hypothetical protein LBH04_02940 [Tannerellaceae bacterium]|nr:hypothetical protein [Tannerellaceae bacterium]
MLEINTNSLKTSLKFKTLVIAKNQVIFAPAHPVHKHNIPPAEKSSPPVGNCSRFCPEAAGKISQYVCSVSLGSFIVSNKV